MLKYVLDSDNKPVACEDIHEWGRWFESADAQRQVGLTIRDGVKVSTVFLGLDHRFTNSGEPILWESMIFGGEHDGWQDRYASYEDALRGHVKALELAFAVVAVDPVGQLAERDPSTRDEHSSRIDPSSGAGQPSSDSTRATDPNTHGWPEGKL